MLENFVEMIVTGKIWIIPALIGIAFGLFLGGIGIFINDFSVFYIGVMLLGLGICSIYKYKHRKMKIDQVTYDKIIQSKLYPSLVEKREEYIHLLKDDCDYLMLTELFKIYPTLYTNYASAVLREPLVLSKPINPYVAGAIGNSLGGLAVGIVAAQNAVIKREKYEESIKNYIKANVTTGNALDQLESCFQSIEAILNKNDDTRSDWNTRKAAIYLEIGKKYKVSGIDYKVQSLGKIAYIPLVLFLGFVLLRIRGIIRLTWTWGVPFTGYRFINLICNCLPMGILVMIFMLSQKKNLSDKSKHTLTIITIIASIAMMISFMHFAPVNGHWCV